MSRAHAVCRTGSTKMSALLSFSIFNTSCRRKKKEEKKKGENIKVNKNKKRGTWQEG